MQLRGERQRQIGLCGEQAPSNTEVSEGYFRIIGREGGELPRGGRRMISKMERLVHMQPRIFLALPGETPYYPNSMPEPLPQTN